MTDGLKAEYRDSIMRVLRGYEGVEQAVLFGSRAMETYTMTSDVDLALCGEGLGLDEVLAIEGEMAGLDVPQKVDILLYGNVKNEKLKEHIEREGVVWFEREEGRSSDWLECRISDLCEFNYGKNLPAKKRNSDGKIPVYGSNGITGYHDEAYVNEPGLIIGRKGTVGSIDFCNQPFWPIDTTFFIPGSAVENILYLYYLFKSIDFSRVSADSAVPGLNRDAAYSIKVKIPGNPDERTAIADVLSSLDNKIELNRQMCETLEKTAGTLFKSWFVDFDPVKAKATVAGNATFEGWSLPRAEAYLARLEPAIAAFFPDSFEESGSEKIPKGWNIDGIGKLVDSVGGATPSTKKPEFWDGEHYWATPKELSSLTHRVLLKTERKITDEGVGEISSGLLPKGTVLLSSRAPIGYVAVVEVSVAINQGFIAMKCNKKIGTQFLLQWTLANLEKIKSYANGSTFQEISKKAFRPIKVSYTDNGLLNEFESIASTLHKRCVDLVKQNNRLTEMRNNLLPRLISGELRVINGKVNL